MQRRLPDASAGFSRFEASIAPPQVAPAPITVWISSMNRMAPCMRLQLGHHRLQPLLEVAAIARAGQQRAHVEREDGGLGQHFRHVALDDALGQALGDGGLADARDRPHRAGCSWCGGRGSGWSARSRSSRPISGSIFPAIAFLLRFTQ